MPSERERRYGDMASLLPLTGRWRVIGEKISGEAISGETTFEWAPARRFLIQLFDFSREGRRRDGMEIIGRPTGADGAREADITGRAFLFKDGLTFDHVYELVDGRLTIRRGAEALLSARFDDDGRRIAGDWRSPAGGGRFEALKLD